MNIKCLGGVRTVTGSSYLVEMGDESFFLVDCGLFQGSRQMEDRNFLKPVFNPRKLAAIFITHAHMDHSGLVPRMVRLGFSGPIYASQATCELLRILWLDSAHIQEMDAQWQTRRNNRSGKKAVQPLYETIDAQNAIDLLVPQPMDCHLRLLPGVDACFLSAGHILGASSLVMTLDDSFRVGFSGDLGRPYQLIVQDPQQLSHVDMLFMECTYGNRLHKSVEASKAELMDVMRQAYEQGGKVLIPAFAVERTQELIYIFSQAYHQGLLPNDMPIFLDSPLAIEATEIFRRNAGLYDDEMKQLVADGQHPLYIPNLKFTPTTEESRAINEFQGPAIVIAGSGMATAGRIRHHLKHNLWRPNCHVVIVGYQAAGSLGRRLVDGVKSVRILQEEVAVKAKIHTINGFSAHADRDELLDWLSGIVYPGLPVYLTHGEEAVAEEFVKSARERFPEANFAVPFWNETIEIIPRSLQASLQPIPQDWAERLDSVMALLKDQEQPLDSTQRAKGEQALRLLENLIRR